MYYSKSAHGFYSRDIHGDNIPSDAVEITANYHAALLAGLSIGRVISHDAAGLPILIDPPPHIPTTDELSQQIDAAADAARAQVAGDPLRAVEYQLAATEAKAFAAAGYPAESVPRTVAAWTINGRTAQQAADSILTEAAAYNEALYLLRETRLKAKDQVRQAMDAGNVAQAQDIATATIASIEAAVAGIGNNA